MSPARSRTPVGLGTDAASAVGRDAPKEEASRFSLWRIAEAGILAIARPWCRPSWAAIRLPRPSVGAQQKNRVRSQLALRSNPVQFTSAPAFQRVGRTD